MTISFSNSERSEKQLEELLKEDFEKIDTAVPELVEIDEEELLEQLFTALEILTDKASWMKNIKITNKEEQKQKFLESFSDDEMLEPAFEFREFPYSEETFMNLLDALIGECQRIDRQTLEKYNAKETDVIEFRELWEQSLEELKLYVKLAANIEDEHEWRSNSGKIWDRPPEHYVEEVKQRLEEGFEVEEKEKKLQAEDLKQMWEEELDRLGLDYSVQIREVSGCFNIPEEETVVVAKGENQERLYSEEEAEMLTKHELFHVVRGYNGRKAGEKSGLPPILGVHTPFYDQTEEGGALYREKATGVAYPEKWRDYHLRFMAAHYLSEQQEFQEAAEKLVELGAEPERAFELLARNREAIRHHIYLNGYRKWEEKEEHWHLLIGKVNERFAEILKKEAEAGGMIQKPEISEEELFDIKTR